MSPAVVKPAVSVPLAKYKDTSVSVYAAGSPAIFEPSPNSTDAALPITSPIILVAKILPVVSIFAALRPLAK